MRAPWDKRKYPLNAGCRHTFTLSHTLTHFHTLSHSRVRGPAPGRAWRPLRTPLAQGWGIATGAPLRMKTGESTVSDVCCDTTNRNERRSTKHDAGCHALCSACVCCLPMYIHSAPPIDYSLSFVCMLYTGCFWGVASSGSATRPAGTAGGNMESTHHSIVAELNRHKNCVASFMTSAALPSIAYLVLSVSHCTAWQVC